MGSLFGVSTAALGGGSPRTAAGEVQCGGDPDISLDYSRIAAHRTWRGFHHDAAALH